ncbi:uncharacterized protein LOC107048676 [Diachasma alloeum]|uniref:uncharacterized protein LOC107048676 n=1 Tax=Diachasma alloeum TaxID=454923 RepID=UPI0007382019|nr:uncharacterized protein LOC107048676 [Diachasma alloeum]
MKYLVGVIAVLVIFTSQYGATPAGDVSYLYLKSRDIRLSLQLYKSRMIPEERKKFDAVEEYYEGVASQMVDLTVAGIDEKNHENCVDSLKTNLNIALTQFLMMTDKCIRASVPQLGIVIEEIDNLISMGGAFEKKVDGMRSTCANHNSASMFEQCLEKYIPELTSSVDYYQDREAKLKTEVQVMTGLGFVQFGECLIQPREEFTTRIDTAEENALECINVKSLSE